MGAVCQVSGSGVGKGVALGWAAGADVAETAAEGASVWMRALAAAASASAACGLQAARAPSKKAARRKMVLGRKVMDVMRFYPLFCLPNSSAPKHGLRSLFSR